MTTGRVIDAHAHILSEATMALMQGGRRRSGPRLEARRRFPRHPAREPHRPFGRGAWDMAKRFSDMDAAGIDARRVSKHPQTFLYNQEAR
jgi:hypothetical protein